MHQQSVVAEVAALGVADTVHEVLVVACHDDSQYPALHRDRPHVPVALNEGVLHLGAFTKYAVDFPMMSRSNITSVSSARSLAISICSALTGLVSAPVSLPCRWALTQLNKV